MNTKSSVLIAFLAATVFCFLAVAQTSQPVTLPATGAPLLVTPEIHLGSPAPNVGATNATGGNTVGASNATASIPLSSTDITSVPLYANGGGAFAFTPEVIGMTGKGLPTPLVHLNTAGTTVGASNATLGNSAGASNATGNLPVVPRAITTMAGYTVGGSTVTVLTPEDNRSAGTSTSESAAVEGATGPQEPAATSSTDLLVGQRNVDADSVADIARLCRKKSGTVKASEYTNDDLERLSEQP